MPRPHHHLARRFVVGIVAFVLVALLVGCGAGGDEHGTVEPGTTGEPSGAVPLKDSDWFAQRFGTPLMTGSTQLQPRAVEQAKDQRGVALPQNHAPLDGPVMWQRVHCEALPFTTTDGPTRLRADTIYAGFAHTTIGAALAAFHLRNFGGTVVTPDAIATIAGPLDRARVVPSLRLDETKVPAREANCLATYRRDGIRRPARWHADQVSAQVYNIEFWFPPAAEGRGYSTDVTVVWAGDDWYLTDQSIGEIGYSGQQKQPIARDEPTGWPRW
ncbi:hypothetical protein OG225_42840 (plasmid) [Nocardia sp. NBC_01377]|uniref:hypothetical protein n=1 Tax=Nocardia sp. NBC_01377 TaxID=2903595 RepID=UPI002F9103F5